MADLNGREDRNRDDGDKDAVAERAVDPFRHGVRGVVTVSVSRSVYSKRAVLAAAYKLSDRWAVLIDDDGPDRFRLYLLGLTEEGASAGVTALVHELTDQAIRERLDDETRDLRTLIVAQAFSEGNLLDATGDSEHPTSTP